MEWYKHHIADYMQATRDLTMLQHGAYLVLLQLYYQQEGPFKVDEKVVFRLCGALHHREKEAVRYVLGKFFIPLEGYWRNTRADYEIQQYQQQCLANRRPIRTANGTTNGTTIRPLEREKEIKKDGCAGFLENGKPCPNGKRFGKGGKWYCIEHFPH